MVGCVMRDDLENVMVIEPERKCTGRQMVRTKDGNYTKEVYEWTEKIKAGGDVPIVLHREKLSKVWLDRIEEQRLRNQMRSPGKAYPAYPVYPSPYFTYNEYSCKNSCDDQYQCPQCGSKDTVVYYAIMDHDGMEYYKSHGIVGWFILFACRCGHRRIIESSGNIVLEIQRHCPTSEMEPTFGNDNHYLVYKEGTSWVTKHLGSTS